MALAEAPFRLSETPSEAELVAKYFRALGEPTRLRILELLAEEDLSVGEIVEHWASRSRRSQTTFPCLRWCGFVASRRDHRVVHYRIADGRVMEAIDLTRSLVGDNAEHVGTCGNIDGLC
jgi:ArsR family transcriptional regulator, cadmium/lead-responsive transcriptional repressor